MMSNVGVPQTDEEAKLHSAENYFEFHIKVIIINKKEEKRRRGKRRKRDGGRRGKENGKNKKCVIIN